MKVEDFLTNNPGLSQNEDELGSVTEIRLSVVVRGISSHFIDFNYMGLHYRAEVRNVINLDEIKDSSLGPNAATISLNRDAVLVVQRAVTAADLANSIPFGFQKLSPVRDEGCVPSEREKAWMHATGYVDQCGCADDSVIRSFSTSTRTGGRPDDERADQFVPTHQM